MVVLRYSAKTILDPVDAYYYGSPCLLKNGESKPYFPMSIWGSHGDPNWSLSDRRKKLSEHVKLLRKCGFMEAAQMCIAYNHNPQPYQLEDEPVISMASNIHHLLEIAGIGWGELVIGDLKKYAQRKGSCGS